MYVVCFRLADIYQINEKPTNDLVNGSVLQVTTPVGGETIAKFFIFFNQFPTDHNRCVLMLFKNSRARFLHKDNSSSSFAYDHIIHYYTFNALAFLLTYSQTLKSPANLDTKYLSYRPFITSNSQNNNNNNKTTLAKVGYMCQLCVYVTERGIGWGFVVSRRVQCRQHRSDYNRFYCILFPCVARTL